jgi:predicted nucleotidyltransferase
MELASFQQVMTALNVHRVRYLLVGGMAVVAHGYGRLTYDIDLVVQLKRDNILRAMTALSELGYRPRVPVTAEQFADQSMRERWIREKGMVVFNLYSDRHRATPIDVFVDEPFDFDKTYAKAVRSEIDGVGIRYVDLQTLIAMKKAAGRPRDIDDIEKLREIAEDER